MRVVYLFICVLNGFAEIINNNNTAVLILARGGSKGVRLKNLQLVGGSSLLTRAIHTAKIAGFHVTVSTDHPLIALESIKSGASVFHRSSITATDWAPSIWGAIEYLNRKPLVKILILLQATSPFTQAANLKGALEKLSSPIPFDCIFSATRSFKLRWKSSSTGVTPINFNTRARPRRQDWGGELLETGAFYIVRRNIVINGSFQNENCTVWEVSSAESFEVDSYHDIKVANVLLSSNLV